MIDIVEKGSYRVAVHEPVDAEQLEPQQVLALCAAGARNGSGDPIEIRPESYRIDAFRIGHCP